MTKNRLTYKWFNVFYVKKKNLFSYDFFVGHHAEFNYGNLHQLSICSHPLHFKIDCRHFNRRILFIYHIWPVWISIWGETFNSTGCRWSALFLFCFIVVLFFVWPLFFPHFQRSPSISASLDGKVGHILIVIFITVTLHLVDRQTEYIARVDYTLELHVIYFLCFDFLCTRLIVLINEIFTSNSDGSNNSTKGKRNRSAQKTPSKYWCTIFCRRTSVSAIVLFEQEEKKKTKKKQMPISHLIASIQLCCSILLAEIYMNRQMKDELYYEEYDNVAIMFATITNYDIQSDATVDIERNILSILNRIICEFDENLLSKNGPLKLEKIKVSGWTYMVACGLDPGRSDSSASLNSGCSSPNQRTSLLSNGRRSWNTFNFSEYYRKFIRCQTTDN